MKGNRRVDTGPETRLRSALHRRGLRFRKDYPVQLPGRKVRPDIVFTARRVAVFVDGCFWHGCPEHGRIPSGSNAAYWHQKIEGNRSRDARQTKALEAEGWLVIRIWEHVPLEEAAEIVAQAMAVRLGT
jgi:DNA mismatch endonuclease (patch repair protein)